MGLLRAIKSKNWLLLGQTMPDLVNENEHITQIPLMKNGIANFNFFFWKRLSYYDTYVYIGAEIIQQPVFF